MKRLGYLAMLALGLVSLSPMAAHAQLRSAKPSNAKPSMDPAYELQYNTWHRARHALVEAVANPNRDADKPRDQYRHPVETVEFFAVTPEMKVAEYAPGGGWYSRVLGNYLGDKGHLTGLFFDTTAPGLPDRMRQGAPASAQKFPADVAGWSGKDASHFSGYTINAIPESEKGTYDRVLLIRMLHNLNRWNMADSEVKAMRDLLKDGGMMGIVQHRAKDDAPYSYSDGSKGYMRESDVVALMETNGFELVGMSEVNANPKDSADHPKGVWEMPPVQITKDPKLANLGESDRMTLLFRKRP